MSLPLDVWHCVCEHVRRAPLAQCIRTLDLLMSLDRTASAAAKQAATAHIAELRIQAKLVMEASGEDQWQEYRERDMALEPEDDRQEPFENYVDFAPAELARVFGISRIGEPRMLCGCNDPEPLGGCSCKHAAGWRAFDEGIDDDEAYPHPPLSRDDPLLFSDYIFWAGLSSAVAHAIGRKRARPLTRGHTWRYGL